MIILQQEENLKIYILQVLFLFSKGEKTMKTINNFNFTTAYTHAGMFHADDVFAAAFCRILNPAIEIHRVFKVDDDMIADPSAIIFDIGGGKFDHHDEPKECRPNGGVPYAAFGKLWREFSTLIVSEVNAKVIDRELVRPVDEQDNGGAKNTLSRQIKLFNPEWDSTESADDCFFEAVRFAERVLRNTINHFEARDRARDAFNAAATIEDGICILDSFLPWQETVINEHPDVMFIIYPSNRGGYTIQTIPVAMGSRKVRKSFPKEWLGSAVPELGITFCHPANFIAATDTLEEAINVAKQVMKGGN